MTDSLALPYQRHVLGNGLTLLLHHDPKVPHVAVNIWYRVGSKNERPGSTGLAHLFEHLMFEGSQHHDGEYFAPLEDVGATQINATTSRDRTNYFETVPVHALDLALWLESDRMGYFLEALTEAKLEEQRSVVLNEMRQGYNQPYGKLWKVIAESTYPAEHPYSWPVIGRQADVEAVTLEDARRWFTTYYAPSNAILTLAGDLEVDDAVERVQRYFGSISAGTPIIDPGVWTAARREHRAVRMQDRVPQAKLVLVWNLPAIAHPDYLALHYAASVLSSGRSSVLFRRLVHTEQMVTDIGASLRPGALASNLVIQADARPGVDLDAITSIVEQELAGVVDKGADAAQLRRTQAQVRASLLRQMQRVGGLSGKANVLASGQAFFDQPDVVVRQLDDGLSLSAADIDRVLRDWVVTSGGRMRGVLRVDVEPFGDRKAADEVVDRSKPPALATPVTPDRPQIDRRELNSGAELLHLHRPRLPLVRVEINLPGGFASDVRTVPGTARMTADALAEGTHQRDSFAISDSIRSLGASLSVSAHLDGTSLAFTALEENLEETLALVSELISEASFPDIEIERLREELRADLSQEEASPGHLAQRLLPGLLYGDGHAYATSFTGLGSAEDLDAISRDMLDQHRQSWYHGPQARLAVAGSLGVDGVVSLLQDAMSRWPQGKPLGLDVSIAGNTRPGVHFVDRPGSEQALLFAGLLAPPFVPESAPYLDIFNSTFGGSFTSRINTNLREERAWTYGAHSTLVTTRGDRPFLVWTEVDQQHALAAIEEVERELAEVQLSRPVDRRELARARDNLLLSLPARWETLAGVTHVMSDLLVYDQPIETLDTYVEGLRQATTEDVEHAISGWLNPERLVWVVVADAAVGRAIEAGRRVASWSRSNGL